MNVKSILAVKGRDVVTINPEQTIKEAIILLDKHNIGALVVLNEAPQIIGILSERDIIRQAAKPGDVFSQLVSEIMTTEVITGVPQDDLHSVSNLMTEKRIRHLPILVEGELVGIISIGDVVKQQRDQYRGEVDTLQTQILANEIQA
jgi:CBS domain-containing protein